MLIFGVEVPFALNVVCLDVVYFRGRVTTEPPLQQAFRFRCLKSHNRNHVYTSKTSLLIPNFSPTKYLFFENRVLVRFHHTVTRTAENVLYVDIWNRAALCHKRRSPWNDAISRQDHRGTASATNISVYAALNRSYRYWKTEHLTNRKFPKRIYLVRFYHIMAIQAIFSQGKRRNMSIVGVALLYALNGAQLEVVNSWVRGQHRTVLVLHSHFCT